MRVDGRLSYDSDCGFEKVLGAAACLMAAL